MSNPYYTQDNITVYNDDCLEVMSSLDSNSFDLIFVDWPYFKVKNEPWDRQWDKPEKFLEWIGQTLEQAHRLLKPNGSFYGCASPDMSTQVELKIGEHFNVLNNVRWYKDAGWHKKMDKEALRSYLSPWEAIIFAEPNNTEGYAKGEAGYTAKCDELRGFVFESLRAYLDSERVRAGISFEQVRQIVGCANGSGLPSHWFTQSQWGLPTKENYLKLREGFGRLNHGGQYLRREYEDLRKEYEDLRRPFNTNPDIPFTDIWTFTPVSDYPGKHPTEKPIALLEHIISVSTKPGARVLDFCMGNGTTLKAAQNLGREAVGIDAVQAYCDRAVMRVKQRSLFDSVITEQTRAIKALSLEPVQLEFGGW